MDFCRGICYKTLMRLSFLLPLLTTLAFTSLAFVHAQDAAPAATPMASVSPSATPTSTKKHRSKKAAATPDAAATAATPAASTPPPSASSPSPATSTRAQRRAAKAAKAEKTAATPGGESPADAETPTATTAPGGGPGMVWVNTKSHVYHQPGSRYYGKTKAGKYVSEKDAIAEGDKAHFEKKQKQ